MPSGSTYSHNCVGADIARLVKGGGPGTCVSQLNSDLQLLSRGYAYVRGSPVPDAHFRRDLADRTVSQARGRIVRHYRYALLS